MEKWVDLKGFEQHYEVSSKGRVKRKKGETIYKDGRTAHFSETILKHRSSSEYHFISSEGYLKPRKFSLNT